MFKLVSRDGCITQFYGACVHKENMMLVTEFLEASLAPSSYEGQSFSWHSNLATACSIFRDMKCL